MTPACLCCILLLWLLPLYAGGTFAPMEFPSPHLNVTVDNRAGQMVNIYFQDMGFDAHVANLHAGAKYFFHASVGDVFYALTEQQNGRLGTFTVGWDGFEEGSAVVHGSGVGRGWVVRPLENGNATAMQKIGNLPRTLATNHPGDQRLFTSRRQNEHMRNHLNRVQAQNRHFPHFTVKGFTHMSFVDQDPTSWQELVSFFQQNKNNVIDETWGASNTYLNHWHKPPVMLHTSTAASPSLNANLIRTVQRLVADWAGLAAEDLVHTSTYGIRLYQNGSRLLNHVDIANTHVLSAIVHVDRQVDYDWPLAFYTHQLEEEYIFMKPGDIVLYESATCIHGRPLPLVGSYYANLFLHFRPVSRWPENEAIQEILYGDLPKYNDTAYIHASMQRTVTVDVRGNVSRFGLFEALSDNFIELFLYYLRSTFQSLPSVMLLSTLAILGARMFGPAQTLAQQQIALARRQEVTAQRVRPPAQQEDKKKK